MGEHKQDRSDKASGQEIPRGEWLSFLDGFSRQHEGWLVTLEVPAGHGRSEVEAENLKLEGITPEYSEGHDRISIALGNTPDDHLTHFVSDPIRVVFLETRPGSTRGCRSKRQTAAGRWFASGDRPNRKP